MGSAIGDLLTEGRLYVLLVDPWKEHVRAMVAKGLILEEQDEEQVILVQATDDVHQVGSVDLVILTAKSYATEQAVRGTEPLIAADTVALSLPNSLGNEEIIARVIGKDHRLGRVTHAGAVLRGPGHVQSSRKDKLTYIGELDGRKTDRALEVMRVLRSAG
jgi:2-dehydropantoate 2-reductase